MPPATLHSMEKKIAGLQLNSFKQRISWLERIGLSKKTLKTW